MWRFIFPVVFAAVFCCCAGVSADYVYEGGRNLRYSAAEIDTLWLDMEYVSLEGRSGKAGGNIYFFDSFYGYLYLIDVDGNVVSRSMGLGRGPNEVPIRRCTAASYDGDEMVIMGSTYDAYIYEHGKCRNLSIVVSADCSDPESSGMYTSVDEIMRSNDSCFYYNVYSESEACNPACTAKSYFKNAHILMQVNMTTGETRPIGHYSQLYRSGKNNIAHLFQVSYDIASNNDFYVSYYADSLIFRYDASCERILSVFGCAGRNMDTDYTASGYGWESLGVAYACDIGSKGMYYWTEYVDECGLLFRSYTKDGGATGGLQVYEGNVLIADVDVPRQFEVVGYSEPYFITRVVCDDDVQRLKFYRFRLK